MRGCLVLNASYEPLRLVPLRRAVVLVLAEKAEVVEEGDQEFRSQTMKFRVPTVIRLLRYVKVPYKRRAVLNLKSVLARDGGKCAYCGKSADSIDHVVPRSRGGKHVWENVVAACRRCNGRKDNKLLSELGWDLPFKPTAPKDTFWIVIGIRDPDPTWESYLALA